MKRRHISFTIASAVLLIAIVRSVSVNAGINLAQNYVPAPEVVGEARLKVLFWKVFDATLVAPAGEFDPAEPFTLTLSYLRAFPGEKIVDSSIEEIAAQGDVDPRLLDTWSESLSGIIPNVALGDAITGVRRADGHTVFYLGDTLLGEIDDPRFTAAFFDIWLGENASRPDLRRQLLGDNA